MTTPFRERYGKRVGWDVLVAQFKGRTASPEYLAGLVFQALDQHDLDIKEN